MIISIVFISAFLTSKSVSAFTNNHVHSRLLPCRSPMRSPTCTRHIYSQRRFIVAGTHVPFYANSEDDSIRQMQNKEKTVVVAGATGYIGKAVVSKSVSEGYKTIALVRSIEKIESKEDQNSYGEAFNGANIVEIDVSDAQALTDFMASYDGKVDTIVSCLASPVGTKKEAYEIDYQATLNCLNAGRDKRVKARHFILLSAFCVRNPLLQLQQAKLKFEAELQAQSDLSWTIVRPTAFFKSVSGQLEGIQNGNPYVLFGNGAITRCNPIAESELAEFMLDSISNEMKKNRILNVGGPDEPLTNQDLGTMMFNAAGIESKFVYAPTWIFDSIIHTLQFFATLTKSEGLEDAAEYARIGKYYAVEDMLTTNPDEKYGTIKIQDHYNSIVSNGQDPFTPIRATAFIGRFLEALPVLIGVTAIPIFFAATNPRLTTVNGHDLSMLLASLSGTFFQKFQ
jgi:divinyl chlorophyllide a 8-vinyl-reductase